MALWAVIAFGVSWSPRTLADDGAPPRTIDIDVVGADLRDVLRLIASVADVNIVYGDEVSGKVTLKLRRVPWQAALQAVLDAKGLEAVRTGRIVRVASSDTLARERSAKLAARKRCLETAPLHTRVIRLGHADAASMAALIQPTLTERGRISVDRRTNTLVIRDVECD